MAHFGTYDALKDPCRKYFTDLNHSAIAAHQSSWNGMTTQQAVYVMIAAMLIYAIGV